MCSTAVINGRECSSVGEFRAALGLPREDVPARAGGELDPDRNCLCNVDVDKAVAIAGAKVVHYERAWSEWEIRKD